MKTSKGISLIEILVVIAMLGIIAGFAYPAYRKYVIKADIATLYSNAIAVQASVVDEMVEDQKSNFEGISFTASDNTSVADGIITVTSEQLVAGDNIEIIMTPSNSNSVITWTCATTNEDFYEYIPKNCHNLQTQADSDESTDEVEDSDETTTSRPMR